VGLMFWVWILFLFFSCALPNKWFLIMIGVSNNNITWTYVARVTCHNLNMLITHSKLAPCIVLLNIWSNTLMIGQ
jgi:hypothetical protein